MKKNTMQTLVAFLAAQTELPADVAIAADEMRAELAKNEAKAQANRDTYAAAHDVVMAHVTNTPQTVAEIFAACENELPDGFSKSKVQYAILNYWKDEVVKHDNGKAAYSYTRA